MDVDDIRFKVAAAATVREATNDVTVDRDVAVRMADGEFPGGFR
jgi:hypothetical protein